MQDYLFTTLGTTSVEVVALFTALKWLTNRMDAFEKDIYARLNNGIKDELTDIKESVAKINGQLEGMPRRRSDPQ
jgi:hypothetical protein